MAIFLFTDIEKSTEKWERYKDAMKKALTRHDGIIKENIERSGGRIIKHTGDGVFAVFDKGNPLSCALEIQKSLEEVDWGEIGVLRIRIGVHAGQAEKVGDDYFGPVINKAARVMSAGWGGQILITPEVKELCQLPPSASLQDLGVHMLKDLGEPQQIYGLIHPDLTIKEFPPVRSLSAHPHNLPSQPTAFVGREQEISEIVKLLDNGSCRLITLIGPGGIGKTRLALQVGAEQIESFHNGVYFIPLAPLTIPSVEFLVFAIADGLRFSFYSKQDPRIQLLNYLREKEMLLILDNFEHLLEAADLLAEILKTAPRVKIIATSRERLGLSGERLFPVRGLEVIEDSIKDSSAIELFLQRSISLCPEFEIKDEDKEHMSRICKLVEGIPLGIELAAAWIRSLSLEEIANEIEKNLDFLTSSLRDSPERHRSLRAVFDYSWNLLPDKEKEVFSRMSVFRGGFLIDAAEKITGANYRDLLSLVDKSLLRKNPDGRFEMLDLIKHYAWEKLVSNSQEKKNVLNLHSKYFAKFLLNNEKHLLGKRQYETLKKIGDEIENIRAGWDYALKQNNLKHIEISLEAIFRYLNLRGRFKEGEELFRRTISMLKGIDKALSARLLARHGVFLFRLGSTDDAEEAFTRSLRILKELDIRSDVALVLNNLGYIHCLKGDFKKAEEFHRKSLEIYEEIGDLDGKVTAIYNLGGTSYRLGRYSEAKEFYEQGLETSEELGDPMGRASAYNNLGLIASRLGNFTQAREMYEKGLEITKQMENQYGIASTLLNLANIAFYLGEYSEAKEAYFRSLAIFIDIGDRDGQALCCNNAGLAYIALKDFNEAKKMIKKSLSVYQEIGDQKGVVFGHTGLGRIATELKDYDEAERLYRESLAICRRIGLDPEEADVLEDLGIVCCKRGRDHEAQKHFYDALKIGLKIKAAPLMIGVLVDLIPIILKKGDKEQALEIIKIGMQHPSSTGEIQEQANEQLKKLRSELPAEKISEVLESKEEIELERFVEDLLKSR